MSAGVVGWIAFLRSTEQSWRHWLWVGDKGQLAERPAWDAWDTGHVLSPWGPECQRESKEIFVDYREEGRREGGDLYFGADFGQNAAASIAGLSLGVRFHGRSSSPPEYLLPQTCDTGQSPPGTGEGLMLSTQRKFRPPGHDRYQCRWLNLVAESVKRKSLSRERWGGV